MIIPTIKKVANQVMSLNRKFLKVLVLAALIPSGSIVANNFQSSQIPMVLQQEEQDKERRVEIEREDLPARIQSDIAEHYQNHTYVQSYKYVDEDGNVTQYEVRVQRQDALDMKLVYNKDGEMTEMIPDRDKKKSKKKK